MNQLFISSSDKIQPAYEFSLTIINCVYLQIQYFNIDYIMDLFCGCLKNLKIKYLTKFVTVEDNAITCGSAIFHQALASSQIFQEYPAKRALPAMLTQIGPFWQDTLDFSINYWSCPANGKHPFLYSQGYFQQHISCPNELPHVPHINGLVLERCNSSASAMELRFSCSNQSI